MKISNRKLGIGIPLSWPFCHSDFFDSFTMMISQEDRPCEYHIIRASSGPIHEMRNRIVSRALDIGCTHVLMLDADMIYPSDTIHKLIAHNKAIVGGLCFKRWPPFDPTLYVGEKYKMTLLENYEKGLVRVTATGTGCLMIESRVFLDMDEPWFEFGRTDEGKPVGEDVNFCYKAGDLGYKIYVDTTLKTQHMAIVAVNENLWRLNRKLQETNKAGFRF